MNMPSCMVDYLYDCKRLLKIMVRWPSIFVELRTTTCLPGHLNQGLLIITEGKLYGGSTRKKEEKNMQSV